MMRKNSVLDLRRRDFLKTVGKAGLSAGLLQGSALTAGMMLSRTAAAQSGTIDRVVLLYVPGGTPFQGGQNLFVPDASLNLKSASSALESVKDEIVFFDNCRVSGGGGHGSTTKCFGGNQRADTYDIELERTLGASSPFPSLLLGVQSNFGNQGYATKRAWQEIAYQDNPIAAFNRVFGGASGGDALPADNLRAQSVLDLQMEEIRALQNTLGAFEKERLDQHIASIERIESRLAAASTNSSSGSSGGGACTATNFNSDGFGYDSGNRARFTIESDLQMDIAIAALQCKLTPVVSIMLSNHQSEQFIPSLDWTDTYHQSIHGGSPATHAETRNYLSERTRYLIDGLKNATGDTGGSLLDNTLVIQATDMADGNAHSTDGAPMLLAGGGSAIQRGKLVDCGAHNNIFDTVTEALGMGSVLPTLGEGPISGVIS